MHSDVGHLRTGRSACPRTRLCRIAPCSPRGHRNRADGVSRGRTPLPRRTAPLPRHAAGHGPVHSDVGHLRTGRSACPRTRLCRIAPCSPRGHRNRADGVSRGRTPLPRRTAPLPRHAAGHGPSAASARGQTPHGTARVLAPAALLDASGIHAFRLRCSHQLAEALPLAQHVPLPVGPQRLATALFREVAARPQLAQQVYRPIRPADVPGSVGLPHAPGGQSRSSAAGFLVDSVRSASATTSSGWADERLYAA